MTSNVPKPSSYFNRRRLMLRSLRYHWRANIVTACAAALAAMTLTGALITGDSLRGTLRSLTTSRLGTVESVLISTGGVFRASLADSLATLPGVHTAPVLVRQGTLIAPASMHSMSIVGVDSRFWSMGPAGSTGYAIADSEAVIGAQLAAAWHITAGDWITLRCDRMDVLPMEAPFSGGERARAVLRCRVSAVAGREQFGEFSLKAEHTAVNNVFVPLGVLSRMCGRPGMASMVLMAGDTLARDRAERALPRFLRPADAGIRVHPNGPGGSVEIVSDAIFIPESTITAIRRVLPQARPSFAYFVNSIGVSGRSVPYSFMSTPPVDGPHDPGDIILGAWAARDLQARVGDTATVRYFVPVFPAGLREESARFRVGGVVPMDLPWADSTLTPPFPGLSDAGSCSDWDPGSPVDLDNIRPQDEAYWTTWRATPKAFINPEMARRIWSNRFGSATALRIPASCRISPDSAEAAIRRTLAAGQSGFKVVNIRNDIARATDRGISFAPLFTGLSFFIIIAGLVLTALLFTFSVESRLHQLRPLAAAGFTRSRIRRLFMGEGAVIAACGSIAGAAIGPVYAGGMLAGLRTIWQGAVSISSSSLHLHVGWMPVGAGAAATFIMAFFALRLALGNGLAPFFAVQGGERVPVRAGERGVMAVIAVCVAGGAVLAFFGSSARGSDAAGVLFGMGTLLLIALLALFDLVLMRGARATRGGRLTYARLVFVNIARRRGRAVATAAVFASGIFILGSVSAFRLGVPDNPRDRACGTGGFTWHAQTVSPIPPGECTPLFFNKRMPEFKETNGAVLAMRLKEGDDASCLNLNRVERPPVLGVDQMLMDSLGAYTFARISPGVDKEHPWLSLGHPPSPGVIRGIADQSVIEWGLGKRIGDTLDYVDDGGQPLRIVLVAGLKNSIFQGRVLIGESDFIRHFPSISGYRLVLADAPQGKEIRMRTLLESAYSGHGLDLQSTVDRLAAFNEVENTYISIFSLLGLLGLLMGCAGVGIVVLGNALERRGECAVLRAQGFTRQRVRRLLMVEHLPVFSAGIVAGLGAAVIAVLPSLSGTQRSSLLLSLAVMAGMSALSGMVSVWVAARIAGEADVMSVLREDAGG